MLSEVAGSERLIREENCLGKTGHTHRFWNLEKLRKTVSLFCSMSGSASEGRLKRGK